MTRYLTFGFVMIILFASCEKENQEVIGYKAGDIDGIDLSHTLLNSPIRINLNTVSDKDTILNDSLFLDVDDDFIPDFIFIIQQRFTKDNLSFPIQTITIKTFGGIFLQLMPGKQPEYGYVRTISLGDTIDSHIPWINDYEDRFYHPKTFFLTQIRANFREAPRNSAPYLPFKYPDGRLGWLLMDFENVDSLFWNIKSFSILEFCIKETR